MRKDGPQQIVVRMSVRPTSDSSFELFLNKFTSLFFRVKGAEKQAVAAEMLISSTKQLRYFLGFFCLGLRCFRHLKCVYLLNCSLAFI